MSKKIEEILKEILNKKEIKKYISLSESIGLVYSFFNILKEQGILNTLDKENQEKLLNSLDNIILYSKKGMEYELGGKEKANKIIEILKKEKLL